MIFLLAQRLKIFQMTGRVLAMGQGNLEALHEWLEAVAAWLGVAAKLVEVPYTEVESLICGAGPALLRLRGREKPGYLALLGSQRRRVMLRGPDLVVHRVPVTALCTTCYCDVEAPLMAEVEHVLDAIGVPRRHRQRAHRTLLDERLSSIRLEDCWVFACQRSNCLGCQGCLVYFLALDLLSLPGRPMLGHGIEYGRKRMPYTPSAPLF